MSDVKIPEATSAQWQAFDQVLNYLNTLETKTVAKKDIYAAVMEMRPALPVGNPVRDALNGAYTAMRVAAALPRVSREYDFTAILAELVPIVAAVNAIRSPHE